MYGPRGDWKSAPADQLRRMGREDTAKALYGVDKPKRQTDERMAQRSQAPGKEQRTSYILPCAAEEIAAPLIPELSLRNSPKTCLKPPSLRFAPPYLKDKD